MSGSFFNQVSLFCKTSSTQSLITRPVKGDNLSKNRGVFIDFERPINSTKHICLQAINVLTMQCNFSQSFFEWISTLCCSRTLNSLKVYQVLKTLWFLSIITETLDLDIFTKFKICRLFSVIIFLTNICCKGYWKTNN